MPKHERTEESPATRNSAGPAAKRPRYQRRGSVVASMLFKPDLKSNTLSDDCKLKKFLRAQRKDSSHDWMPLVRNDDLSERIAFMTPTVCSKSTDASHGKGHGEAPAPVAPPSFKEEGVNLFFKRKEPAVEFSTYPAMPKHKHVAEYPAGAGDTSASVAAKRPRFQRRGSVVAHMLFKTATKSKTGSDDCRLDQFLRAQRKGGLEDLMPLERIKREISVDKIGLLTRDGGRPATEASPGQDDGIKEFQSAREIELNESKRSYPVASKVASSSAMIKNMTEQMNLFKGRLAASTPHSKERGGDRDNLEALLLMKKKRVAERNRQGNRANFS